MEIQVRARAFEFDVIDVEWIFIMIMIYKM